LNIVYGNNLNIDYHNLGPFLVVLIN